MCVLDSVTIDDLRSSRLADPLLSPGYRDRTAQPASLAEAMEEAHATEWARQNSLYSLQFFHPLTLAFGDARLERAFRRVNALENMANTSTWLTYFAGTELLYAVYFFVGFGLEKDAAEARYADAIPSAILSFLYLVWSRLLRTPSPAAQQARASRAAADATEYDGGHGGGRTEQQHRLAAAAAEAGDRDLPDAGFVPLPLACCAPTGALSRALRITPESFDSTTVVIFLFFMTVPIWPHMTGSAAATSSWAAAAAKYSHFSSVYTDRLSFFLVWPCTMFVCGIRFPHFLGLVTVLIAVYAPLITRDYAGDATQLVLIGGTVAVLLAVRQKEVEINHRRLFLLQVTD